MARHPGSSPIFALLLACTLAPTAKACDFCLISQGISPLETLSGSGLRITQRYSLNDELFHGTDEINNPGASERFFTTDFSAFYGVEQIPGLLLTANLPVRSTRQWGEAKLNDATGDIDFENVSGSSGGIGDISLLARYTFFTQHTLDTSFLLAATVGVKLPTGGTDGRTTAGDEFLDAHVQAGTGSTDALLGLSANLAHARLGLSANMLSGITGEGEVGDTDHSFGDWLNYDVTGRYRVWPSEIGAGGNSVFLSLGMNGEWRGHETQDGAEVDDSGGHTVYIAPGLQINFAEHWVAEFSYQRAVYHDLNSVQLGENYKVFGSITYSF
ncbi:MAG: hypothetical protein U1F34_02120 [Gammaproteobacteria bacterium]